MYTKQISVFLENKTGSLSAMTKVLGEQSVDLYALSIADSDTFGVLRCVTKSDDIPKALNALRTGGYTARVSDVICVCVPDKPMGLATVLDLIKEAGISIEYIYSFYKNTGDNAVLILRPSEKTRCVNVLNENGIRTLTQEEVNVL